MTKDIASGKPFRAGVSGGLDWDTNAARKLTRTVGETAKITMCFLMRYGCRSIHMAADAGEGPGTILSQDLN
jgi:hypothetical protein